MAKIILKKPAHLHADAAMAIMDLYNGEDIIIDNLELLDILLKHPKFDKDTVFQSGEKTFDFDMVSRFRFERGFEVRS